MRTAYTLLVAFLVTACLWPQLAFADRDKSWPAANRAYQEGRFDQAAEHYQALVTAGVSHQDLFYNLGNAYFRSGRLGLAIYNYERALAIEPSFADAAYNLEVARSLVAEQVVDRLEGAEREPLWIRAVTFFTIGQLTLAFLAINALFFALLATLRFLSSGFVRTALMVTGGFGTAALAVALVLLAGHIYYLERVERGIVLANQVQMREGKGEHTDERGELHPGLEVRVVGSDGDWTRIRLANGVEGWVPSDTIGQI